MPIRDLLRSIKYLWVYGLIVVVAITVATLNVLLAVDPVETTIAISQLERTVYGVILLLLAFCILLLLNTNTMLIHDRFKSKQLISQRKCKYEPEPQSENSVKKD